MKYECNVCGYVYDESVQIPTTVHLLVGCPVCCVCSVFAVDQKKQTPAY